MWPVERSVAAAGALPDRVRLTKRTHRPAVSCDARWIAGALFSNALRMNCSNSCVYFKDDEAGIGNKLSDFHVVGTKFLGINAAAEMPFAVADLRETALYILRARERIAIAVSASEEVHRA
jgi:hypothetical protein